MKANSLPQTVVVSRYCLFGIVCVHSQGTWKNGKLHGKSICYTYPVAIPIYNRWVVTFSFFFFIFFIFSEIACSSSYSSEKIPTFFSMGFRGEWRDDKMFKANFFITPEPLSPVASSSAASSASVSSDATPYSYTKRHRNRKEDHQLHPTSAGFFFLIQESNFRCYCWMLLFFTKIMLLSRSLRSITSEKIKTNGSFRFFFSLLYLFYFWVRPYVEQILENPATSLMLRSLKYKQAFILANI